MYLSEIEWCRGNYGGCACEHAQATLADCGKRGQCELLNEELPDWFWMPAEVNLDTCAKYCGRFTPSAEAVDAYREYLVEEEPEIFVGMLAGQAADETWKRNQEEAA